jgi:CheY-like chemotaxis protein
MRQYSERSEVQTLSSSQFCILVVEDNDASALVTTTFLDSSGYSYDLAKDGSQAVEKAKSGRFAMILMDVTMPVMNGWTATRSIREFERANGKKHLPIIGVTANVFVEDKELCLAAGMDGFIAKPINFELLEEKLKAHLGG